MWQGFLKVELGDGEQRQSGQHRSVWRNEGKECLTGRKVPGDMIDDGHDMAAKRWEKRERSSCRVMLPAIVIEEFLLAAYHRQHTRPSCSP
jgi:hypothetical protein